MFTCISEIPNILLYSMLKKLYVDCYCNNTVLICIYSIPSQTNLDSAMFINTFSHVKKYAYALHASCCTKDFIVKQLYFGAQ